MSCRKAQVSTFLPKSVLPILLQQVLVEISVTSMISTDAIDKAIVEAAIGMKEGTMSDVIALNDGTYAIIRVSEVVEGQSFKLQDVKDHIQA